MNYVEQLRQKIGHDPVILVVPSSSSYKMNTFCSNNGTKHKPALVYQGIDGMGGITGRDRASRA